MSQQTQMEEFDSFGNWLRRQRRALDLTQAALAKRASCSAATIRKIEADERKPSRELAELLATALGVPDEARVAFVQAARQTQVTPRLPTIHQTPPAATLLHNFSDKRSHNLTAPTTPHVDSVPDAVNVAGLLDEVAQQQEILEPRLNLPRQSTPFVGRTDELAQLHAYLSESTCRLLTLVGPGGIGKTRLALEIAERLQSRFQDGVYFTALAPLSDPSELPVAIAEATQLSFAPGQPPRHQLIDYLRDRHMLLILDNIEHLLTDIGLISELVQAAPGVKILVTSRERLQLRGEVAVRLGGLGVHESETPEATTLSAAVQLFVQSAQRLQPSFELTQETLGALRSVCLLVQGMPLGILLASSWIETLTVTEIAQEIERSFEFLEGGWRDLPERQRSLRAVFDHSWGLLTGTEQAAMRHLSVFRGGFTRAAAEQVAGISAKTLTSLVNKSLLTRDASGRFDIHELLRQYSSSDLDRRPDERKKIHEQHASHYARFMDERWTPIRSPGMRDAVAEITTEIGNIRATWSFIVDQLRLPELHMVARVLWYFLMVRARYEEGVELFERAVNNLLASPNGEARDLALGEALHNLGFFHTANGRPRKGKQLAEECLARLHVHPAIEIAVRAYITLCRSELLLGEYHEMKARAQEGLSIAELIDDPWYMGPGLFLLGMAEIRLEQHEQALLAGEAAVKHLEKAGDAYYQALCLSLVLGQASLRLGRHEEAKRFYLRSLDYFENIQDRFEIAQTNRDLSEVYAVMNEFDAAKQAHQSSLRYYANMGQIGYVISNLVPISKTAELQGQHLQAVEMLALTVNHPKALPLDKQKAHRALILLRDQLSTADFSTAFECGKALDLEALVTALLEDGH